MHAPDGMPIATERPLIDAYLADPFVLAHGGGYYVTGTGEAEARGATGRSEPSVFPLYSSPDLEHFTLEGHALVRPPAELGDTFWAPEIAFTAGIFYLYYSVGFADRRHQLRVATSVRATGPYRDAGVLLSWGSEQRFAIDPHPFRDEDGRHYLFYARDFLDEVDEHGAPARPGTALVVQELESMLRLGPKQVTVLRAHHPWQRFLAERALYGRVFDWHTLEGPAVVQRDGRYYCFYSGGRWDSDRYGVDYAVASSVLGPYTDAGAEAGPRVLASVPGVRLGPGHNSIVRGPDGLDYIAYHAWDREQRARRFHLSALAWTADGPRARGSAVPFT